MAEATVDDICENIDDMCVKADDMCVKADDICAKADDICAKADDMCSKADDNSKKIIKIYSEETFRLVNDVLCFYFQRRGLTWEMPESTRDATPRFTERIGDAVMIEFRRQRKSFHSLFQNEYREIHLLGTKLVHNVYRYGSALFRDGFDWNKLLTLFAFAGELAVLCVRLNKNNFLESLCCMVYRFIFVKLKYQIEEAGGFEDFANFCERISSARLRQAF